MNLDIIYNVCSLGTALVIFGYKAAQVESKIEKLIINTERSFNDKINNLNDYIDSLKTELLILKKEINKDDEISVLKVSKTEYELRQEIKFINLQIKQIIKSLESVNCKVKLIDKDTL